MKLFEQATALARADRPKDAVALIENAAQSGDCEGNFILAHWLLYGSDRPRDVRAGYRHLESAAQKGHSRAGRALAHLTASGTGCEADEAKALEMLRDIAGEDPVAAEQLSLLPRMMSAADAKKAKRERVSSDPRMTSSASSSCPRNALI